MINKHNGDIQLSNELMIGSNFNLAAFTDSADFHLWEAHERNDEQDKSYQRNLLDIAGRPLTVLLSFYRMKLDAVFLSYQIADEPNNPIGPIARQFTFHESWLRNELGDAPYNYIWGWIGHGGCATPGPAHAIVVLFRPVLDT
ncbi:MAG: hypothetical protein H0X30_00060 [Anaerolineae bacterium]|nr:hypothetical protein [Anaerolineae bacterium]